MYVIGVVSVLFCYYRLLSIVVYQWSTFKELGGPLAMVSEGKTPCSRALVPLQLWSKAFHISVVRQTTAKLLTLRRAVLSESTSLTSNAPWLVKDRLTLVTQN